MEELQYKDLCEACDRILLAPESGVERVAISWLHVIREHPIFLNNYSDLFESKRRITDFKIRCVKKIRNLASILRLFTLASFKKSRYWHESKKLTPNIDFLFISHLLNDSQAGKENDFYFGKVPNELASKGHTVLIALINHSGQSGTNRVKKWNNSLVSRIILSDFLKVSEEIASLRQLNKESRKLIKFAKNEQSKLDQKVLIRASIEALSNSSLTSLRLNKQIVALVERFKPKAIIVTHEGHAWERVAFAAARKTLPEIKCIGYQHAALFRLQHAIRRNLKSEFNPDIILTAGLVGKAQLEQTISLKNIPISVLGSDRGFRTTPSNNESIHQVLKSQQNQRPGCLVIPEGEINECNLLFEFALECAQLCPEVDFIWRLHPLITFKSLIANNLNFRGLPSNIIMSQETLEKDISRCYWSLYRGTTAIIKGVSAGLRPIYLQVVGEMTIDPLYDLEIWKETVMTSQNFKEIIDRDIHEGYSTSFADFAFAKKYCESFFLPFNSTQLDRSLITI